MTTNHTPVPWAVTVIRLGTPEHPNLRYEVHQDPRPRFGMHFELHHYIDGSGGRGVIYSQEQAKADAEFVVLAANNHERLISALKNLLIDAEANITDGDAIRDARALYEELKP